ncbi:hypothetical protein SESBI_35518 [Sesbania bispinosa]|nr:hypothetical protein SESBI_35518 [Sesbania bispinosa]
MPNNSTENMANYEDGNDDTHSSYRCESPNPLGDSEERKRQSEKHQEERYDFIDGLKKLIAMSDSMINCVKAVKTRLEGMDERIDALHLQIGNLDNKINTIVNFTKKMENEIGKCNKDDPLNVFGDISGNDDVKLDGNYGVKLDGNDMQWPRHTNLKMETNKSPIDESPKGVSTVIFDVSDDDEDYVEIMGREKCEGRDNGPNVKGSCLPKDHGKGKIPQTFMQGRKLFHTPPSAPSRKSSKKPKVYNDTSFTFPNVMPKMVASKHLGNILPKTMLCKFRPTTDMALTEMALKVVAYLFAYDNDDEEILFRVGEHDGRRKDFQSLCPDRIVHEEVISMATIKGTWNQCHGSCPSVWFCPPSFVVSHPSSEME